MASRASGVNVEMGALKRPPGFGWALGQDGVEPTPAIRLEKRMTAIDLIQQKRRTVSKQKKRRQTSAV